MRGVKNSYTEAQPNGIIGLALCWCLTYVGKNLCSKGLIFPRFWCKLVIMYFEF